jgi:hypothetical protein
MLAVALLPLMQLLHRSDAVATSLFFGGSDC